MSNQPKQLRLGAFLMGKSRSSRSVNQFSQKSAVSELVRAPI